MATWAWRLQGVSPTTIGGTNYLQLTGGAVNTSITVAAYNSGSHVKSVGGGGGSDLSSGNTPVNVKFISAGGGTAGSSQADWGGGTEDIAAMLTTESTLDVEFTDASSVATSAAKFFAYQTTTTDAPTGITFWAYEADQTITQWVAAEASAGALNLNAQGAATNHDFYIAVSASPDSVGLKDFTLRAELTYT